MASGSEEARGLIERDIRRLAETTTSVLGRTLEDTVKLSSFGEEVGAAHHRDSRIREHGRAVLSLRPQAFECKPRHRPLTSSMSRDSVARTSEILTKGRMRERGRGGDRRSVRVVGEHHGRMAEPPKESTGPETRRVSGIRFRSARGEHHRRARTGRARSHELLLSARARTAGLAASSRPTLSMRPFVQACHLRTGTRAERMFSSQSAWAAIEKREDEAECRRRAWSSGGRAS